MKKSISKIALLALLAGIFAFTVPTAVRESYKADVADSKITWIGRKVTGEHNGVITLKDGSLEVEDGKLVGGEFAIDMGTMTCLDLDAEGSAKLIGHLKSADFFGVEKYPTSKFVITNVVHQGKNDYKVVGDLTIKETTKEVKFPAVITMDGNMVKAEATIVVDRAEFDVRYGSGSFFDNLGDKTIYDNFDIGLSLVAKK